MKRREVLKNLAALGGFQILAPLLGRNAWAGFGNDDVEGFFVTMVMQQGWDTTLSLEPWTDPTRLPESEIFIEYPDSDLIHSDNLILGPAMAPMKNHFKDIAVVNGVYMSPTDSGHTPLLSYALTGDSNNKRADYPAELASNLPSTPMGVVSDQPVFLASRSVDVTNPSSLGNMSELIETAKDFDGDEQTATGLEAEYLKVKNNIQKFTDMNTLLQGPLKALPGDNPYKNTAAAFKVGLSRSAQLSFSCIDSHGGHKKAHLASQIAAWTRMATVMDIFKAIEYKPGQSLFDWTTFLVVSEFSRTPALNPGNGKDHNPWTNSALLAGRGIKGGVRVGASEVVQRKTSRTGVPYSIALNLDPATGDVKTTKETQGQGVTILPTHVMATVTDAIGLDRGVFGMPKTVAALAPVLKKS